MNILPNYLINNSGSSRLSCRKDIAIGKVCIESLYSLITKKFNVM